MANKPFAAYRIKRKLWERSDGVACFLADQVALEREVELRVVGQGLAEGSPLAERFAQEFRTLAALDHPSIAPVLDLGCSGGKLYYVTAARGTLSLTELIERGDFAEDLGRLLELAEQLADALGYLHASHVLHRGLRPDAVQFDQAARRYYVTGFEMLRPTDLPSLTQRGVPQAPALVAAPEMGLLGAVVDDRADQFLLGMLLLSAASREDLARGDGLAYANAEVRQQALARLRATGAPGDLVALLARLTATAPAERCRDMQEVLLELARIRERLGAGASAPAVEPDPAVAPAPPVALASPAPPAPAAPSRASATTIPVVKRSTTSAVWKPSASKTAIPVLQVPPRYPWRGFAVAAGVLLGLTVCVLVGRVSGEVVDPTLHVARSLGDVRLATASRQWTPAVGEVVPKGVSVVTGPDGKVELVSRVSDTAVLVFEGSELRYEELKVGTSGRDFQLDFLVVRGACVFDFKNAQGLGIMHVRTPQDLDLWGKLVSVRVVATDERSTVTVADGIVKAACKGATAMIPADRRMVSTLEEPVAEAEAVNLLHEAWVF